MGYSHWALVQYAAGIRFRVTMIYRLIKPIVGTDGYGSQAPGYPKTNRNAGSRLAQPRFGREESIKEPWHDLGIDALPGAEPRCGCAPLPNRDVPSLSWSRRAFRR